MEERLFNGFPRHFLMLLAENQFNDSRSFYESKKEEIKRCSTIPMRNLCSDLSDRLFMIDEQMNLIPTKMVSRVRRDTRFSKNKDMYRNNMWCMFMRDKNTWKYSPCMWFEVTPGGWSCGVGIFRGDATFMEWYRKTILENQKEFKKAIKSIESSGAVPDIEQYKKLKPGGENIEKSIRAYYNAKSIYFIDYSSDLEPLFDGSVEDILFERINQFEPFYKFILKAYEKMIAERGQENE